MPISSTVLTGKVPSGHSFWLIAMRLTHLNLCPALSGGGPCIGGIENIYFFATHIGTTVIAA